MLVDKTQCGWNVLNKTLNISGKDDILADYCKQGVFEPPFQTSVQLQHSLKFCIESELSIPPGHKRDGHYSPSHERKGHHFPFLTQYTPGRPVQVKGNSSPSAGGRCLGSV